MTRTGAVRRMFPGGNTSLGFYSFYDNVIGPEARRVFILKGGPGAGKSTFMTRIADRLVGMGLDAEFHHCSADAPSVDAVVFPGPGIALFDGTSPHVIDPKFPGLVDEIVDLGQFGDDDALRPHGGDIMRLSAAGRRSFQRAYNYLAAAQAVRSVEAAVHRQAADEAFVHRRARRLVDDVLGVAPAARPGARAAKDGRPGRRRRLFASSITPGGPVHHLDTLVAGLPHVFVVRARPGAGASTLLEKVAAAVTDEGWDAELFHCALDPHTLEHVVVAGLGAAVITSRPPHDYEPHGAVVIDLDDGVTLAGGDARHAHAARRMFGNLFEHAVAALSEARRYHLEVEALYRPAMDFAGMDQLRDSILNRILAYASGDT